MIKYSFLLSLFLCGCYYPETHREASLEIRAMTFNIRNGHAKDGAN